MRPDPKSPEMPNSPPAHRVLLVKFANIWQVSVFSPKFPTVHTALVPRIVRALPKKRRPTRCWRILKAKRVVRESDLASSAISGRALTTADPRRKRGAGLGLRPGPQAPQMSGSTPAHSAVPIHLHNILRGAVFFENPLRIRGTRVAWTLGNSPNMATEPDVGFGREIRHFRRFRARPQGRSSPNFDNIS